MKDLRQRSSERGFTLQELLVVIMVSSILVTFTLQLFGFVSKLVVSSQRKSEVRDVVNRILRAASSDIESASEVTEVTDSTLVVLRQTDREVRYWFSRTTVVRGEDTLNSPKGVSVWLRVQIVGKRDSTSTKPERVFLKVLGSSRSFTYDAEATVSIPWSSAAAIRNRPHGERVMMNTKAIGDRP